MIHEQVAENWDWSRSMLNSQHRLRDNEDFQNAFEKGKSVGNRQIVIYMLAKEGQERLRVGYP